MKRQIIYPGAIPLETDLLNTNKNTMVALGKLVAATFGTSTFASGLGCNPNSPAALNVVISPGEIYSLQNIDGTAYSSLAADTTHQIMKQGISLDAVTLTCAAPGTAGQSINYLIQAAFSEVDSTPVVLPYYNASNPPQAYSGPANAGTTNNTARDGQVVLSAKAGVAATTGSQITPAVDSGYVGLWVVTVANGQTTIVAGNIAQATSAPFFGTAALLNVLNAFTVSPTVPTPAQFDATTKAATTAFVQRALGSQRFLFGMTASTVLTAAHVGCLIGCNAPGNYTLTLPSFTGLPSGSSISFIHSAGTSAPVTILAGGVDVIRSEGNVLPGIVLDLNQHVTLTTDGGTGWYVDNWNIYGATPPLFDNSTRLATTAALRLAGLSYSGITIITASRAITAADMGSIVYFAGAYTLTFPTPASLGIPIGGSVTLYNTGTTVTAVAGAGASFDTRATPVNIAVGDFLTFTATAGNQWAQFGTGDLGKTVQFSSSISANGYQKLPSGLIVQWGTVATGAMSAYPAIPTTTSVTFPTAFPAACHVVSGNLSGGIGGGWLATTAEVLTPAGFTLRASSQAAIASQNFTYIAIGR